MSPRERLLLIREDCRADAAKPVPFTPLGIGTVHGEMLAMIDALAATILEQQERIESLEAIVARAEAAAIREASR